MRLPWWFWTTTAGLIVGAALAFSVPARALTDGMETVCQPQHWGDCERFTPVHRPVLKITGHMGGRLG